MAIEFRFRPGTLHIKHGATLTFREGPPQPPFAFPEGVDPHTLSIVRRADLPQTLRELVTNDHPVTTARVTAPAGTTLHYLCAVHSWMQGKLVVE